MLGVQRPVHRLVSQRHHCFGDVGSRAALLATNRKMQSKLLWFKDSGAPIASPDKRAILH